MAYLDASISINGAMQEILAYLAKPESARNGGILKASKSVMQDVRHTHGIKIYQKLQVKGVGSISFVKNISVAICCFLSLKWMWRGGKNPKRKM